MAVFYLVFFVLIFLNMLFWKKSYLVSRLSYLISCKTNLTLASIVSFAPLIFILCSHILSLFALFLLNSSWFLWCFPFYALCTPSLIRSDILISFLLITSMDSYISALSTKFGWYFMFVLEYSLLFQLFMCNIRSTSHFSWCFLCLGLCAFSITWIGSTWCLVFEEHEFNDHLSIYQEFVHNKSGFVSEIKVYFPPANKAKYWPFADNDILLLSWCCQLRLGLCGVCICN